MLSTQTRTFLLALTCLGVGLSSSNAWAIKKCQDDQGKWHYGDFAVQACSKSKVTTLDERGVVKEERAAPLTKEEVSANAENVRLENERLEKERAEREERNRILSIYETEADIQRQRENQTYSVQSNIDVTKAYIASLNERLVHNDAKIAATSNESLKKRLEGNGEEFKRKIVDGEKQLVDLEQQKKAVELRFAQELKLYRELRATE